MTKTTKLRLFLCTAALLANGMAVAAVTGALRPEHLTAPITKLLQLVMPEDQTFDCACSYLS